jgi:hypothetical protein
MRHGAARPLVLVTSLDPDPFLGSMTTEYGKRSHQKSRNSYT